jgi:hypothetical protein
MPQIISDSELEHKYRMLCTVFAHLGSAACDLKSFGSRLRAGLYGVGDAVGALLMPPGAISLLVDADAV